VNSQISISPAVPGAMMPAIADAPTPGIVFLASQGAVFQGLVKAIQDYLPAFTVSLVDHLPPSDSSEGNVRLVLIYVGGHASFDASAEACRNIFPNASIGLVVESMENALMEANLFDGSLQGVLPLSLKLEVWLAAMALLLTGGEYYPPPLTRKAYDDRRPEPQSSAASSPGPDDASRPHLGRSGLTARERQVLELVSQGYQNKIIASRMSLSEHTVKLHVHNLITKLRVNNRTQAAAAFRSAMDRQPPPALAALDKSKARPRERW
jgi:DNA-binding NarL/FixJ family response regulator